MLVFVMDWSSSVPSNRPFDAPARTPVSRQGVYLPLLSPPGCDGEPSFTNFCICHTSKKCAGNSFPCHTSKNTRFKTLCLPHIQKMTGVGGILLTRHATSMPVLSAPDFPGSDRRESTDLSSNFRKNFYPEDLFAPEFAYEVRCTKMPAKCCRWRKKRIPHRITTTMASGRPRVSMSR
jgi:hypothetical protein